MWAADQTTLRFAVVPLVRRQTQKKAPLVDKQLEMAVCFPHALLSSYPLCTGGSLSLLAETIVQYVCCSLQPFFVYKAIRERRWA